MKKLILSLSVIIVMGIVITSCKKYPDGPSLTIYTKTHRLARTWKISQYLFNGADKTSYFNSLVPNYTETYDNAGNYSYASGSGSGSGKWVFENDKLQIKRSGVSGQSSDDLTILKLKTSDFWYSIKNGSDTEEFHFVQK